MNNTTRMTSYRLGTEALQKLERLATYYNRSRAQQLTWLINRAYEELPAQEATQQASPQTSTTETR